MLLGPLAEMILFKLRCGIPDSVVRNVIVDEGLPSPTDVFAVT